MLLKPDLKHPQIQPMLRGLTPGLGRRGGATRGQNAQVVSSLTTGFLSFAFFFLLFFLLYHFLKPSKRMIVKERETNMTHDCTRERKEWKATGDEDDTEYRQKKPGLWGKAISVSSSQQRGA